jgi:hypothetical protein
MKIVRPAGTGNPAIELQEWDSTITTQISYWDIVSVSGQLQFRDRSNNDSLVAMTLDKTTGNTTIGNLLVDNITANNLTSNGTITSINISGTNTGDQFITLTGAITGSGTGNITTIFSSNTITLPASTTIIPASPALGNVTIFGKTLANRSLAATVDASGIDAVLQPSIWRQKVGNWNPPGNSTTVPGVFGMIAPTVLGTATARNVATTNLFTRQRRLGYVSSSSSAGSFCGHYINQAQFTTGDGSGLGGFFYSCRFGVSDTTNPIGTRMFVGMSSSVTAPTNVEPTTLTNCIGVAQLSSSTTQLFIVYGGSAAQTAIALGTNFPPYTGTGATLGVSYDLTLFCPVTLPGVVYYRLERIGTSFIAEGTLTPTTVGTQTPASSTLLAHRAWRTNNNNSGVVGIDIIGFYTETDY